MNDGAHLNLSVTLLQSLSTWCDRFKTWRTDCSGAMPGKENNKPATAGVGLMQALDLSRTALLKNTVLSLSGCLTMTPMLPNADRLGLSDQQQPQPLEKHSMRQHPLCPRNEENPEEKLKADNSGQQSRSL